MVKSKEWDWEQKKGGYWLEPCEECYYYISDMKKLPFSDNIFDCIWAYHVISLTDTEGFLEILSEIERVLKPNGMIYLSMCSKETWSFQEANFEHIDENTIIKLTDGPEKDVPHYYVNFDDIFRLFKNFSVKRIRHIDDCYFDNNKQNSKHYYIEATFNKSVNETDHQAILEQSIKERYQSI